MKDIVKKMGLDEINTGAGTAGDWLECRGEFLESISPINGHVIGRVKQASAEDYEVVAAAAARAARSSRIASSNSEQYCAACAFSSGSNSCASWIAQNKNRAMSPRSSASTDESDRNVDGWTNVSMEQYPRVSE